MRWKYLWSGAELIVTEKFIMTPWRECGERIDEFGPLITLFTSEVNLKNMGEIHVYILFTVKKIWVNIGSDNGMLPGGTNPLTESMLTYHQ